MEWRDPDSNGDTTIFTLLRAFDALRRAVAGGDLDPVAREVAGIAVGAAVDNAYGVAFHSMALGRLGVDDAEVERMRAGRPPAESRLTAVHAFARVVALGRGKVTASSSARAPTRGTTRRKSSRSSPSARSRGSSARTAAESSDDAQRIGTATAPVTRDPRNGRTGAVERHAKPPTIGESGAAVSA
jgi:hypothetical protein